jgi:hypothetical protein
VLDLLNLLKLQSILSIETVSSQQHIHDALDKAFEHDLVVTQQALFVGKSTYKKVRDVPLTLYGPLGAKALPLVIEIKIHENNSKTKIEIHSSLLKSLIQNKLIFSFIVCLCLIIVMAIVIMKMHSISIILAPLIFWFFALQILQSEAQYTKKAIEAIILGA